MMQVTITVAVREGPYDWESRQQAEVQVQAELEALQIVPWSLLCAGLAENIIEQAAAVFEQAATVKQEAEEAESLAQAEKEEVPI